MYKIKLFLIILLNTASSFFYGQDFEVSPVKIEYSIDPGESQSKILYVKNHSNFQTPFSISIVDFLIDKDGNKMVANKNSTKNSCADWITLDNNFFTLNPGEKTEIKVTMQAPDEDYKTRWAMIYVETTKVKSSFDADQSLGAAVNIGGRIAVQVYRTPLSKPEAKLSVNQLTEKISTKENHRMFSVLIENGGVTIEKCKLIYIAADLNTGEEYEFDPIFFDSFPDAQREILFFIPSTLPPGEYSLVALLDYGINTSIKGTRLKERLLIIDKNNK